MKTIQLNDIDNDLIIDVNVKNEWSDLNLKDYLDFIQIISDEEKAKEESYVYDLLPIICDIDLNIVFNMRVTELEKLSTVITELANKKITETPIDHKMIDDVLYVFKTDMKDLRNNEVIAIKSIAEKEKNTVDVYLSTLAVLIRPGFIKDTNGLKKYVQHPLDFSEIVKRKELLLTKLNCEEVIPLINFFFSGTNK